MCSFFELPSGKLPIPLPIWRYVKFIEQMFPSHRYTRSSFGLSRLFNYNSGTSRPQGQRALKHFASAGFASDGLLGVGIVGLLAFPQKMAFKFPKKFGFKIIMLNYLFRAISRTFFGAPFFGVRGWGSLRCSARFWAPITRGKWNLGALGSLGVWAV